MKLVSSAAQMRSLDKAVAVTLGLPSIVLMELASKAVADVIRLHHDDHARAGVVVACGPGNNGGDGYGVARWLAAWGYPVRTISVRTASGGDAGVMREVCERVGVLDVKEIGSCGLIVDAILGTGVTRKLRDPVRSLVAEIEAHPAPVVSIDLPSGLHADTGQPMGAWVRAVRTVTFGRLKPALLLEPGADLAGEVHLADIGLEAAVDTKLQAIGEVLDASDLADLWPTRRRAARKRSSGHLLVVAGSLAMAGAAVLACRGALSAGVGLVTLLTPQGALVRLANLPSEVMVEVSGAGDVMTEAPVVDISRFDGMLAGPGLGGGHALEDGIRGWLRHLWELDGRPMLYDADALAAATGGAAGPRVITPHAGEAARLLECAATAVQRNRVAAASKLANLGVSVLKGPNTIVSARRRRLNFNQTGNAILATAGSGDVLAGLIAGLMVRGIGAWDAARLGVWVHGQAADCLATERVDGWTASDVADAIPAAVAHLRLARRP